MATTQRKARTRAVGFLPLVSVRLSLSLQLSLHSLSPGWQKVQAALTAGRQDWGADSGKRFLWPHKG